MKGSNLAAFLGGMFVGGIVALLLAPESGEQTRKNIKEFLNKEMDDIKDNCANLSERMKKEYESGKSKVQEKLKEMKMPVEA